MSEQGRRTKNEARKAGDQHVSSADAGRTYRRMFRPLSFVSRLPSFIRHSWPLVLLLLLALALRLLVWHWRGAYPLGGDESEYLEQARTLLTQHRYVELQLMRPPLYTLFLAGSIVLFDSLAQNLRLVQAFVSAATLVPMWLLCREIIGWGQDERRKTKDEHQRVFVLRLSSFVPTIACLLTALSYTLAANATELLSETLFLFGLTTLFWLIVRVGRLSNEDVEGSSRWAALGGITLGLLCLTRSVALPLLPLGALWLVLQRTKNREPQGGKLALLCSAYFVLGSLLVIVPWTTRNYVTYGALIVIDTTGAENLWLDNNPDARTPSDPLGREDAKRQLYALGDDRAARQRLASERGTAAIRSHPDWFLDKAYGETLKFFALEYSDDMRARPAIWVPPAEIWTRLVLGDGLWLVVLLVGVYGLSKDERRNTKDEERTASFVLRLSSFVFCSPRWLFLPWALYILFTALLFHVELRYRLPLYPALIPYASLVLINPRRSSVVRHRSLGATIRLLCCLLPAAFCLLMTLLHAPYPSLAWTLGWKHYHLAVAERALAEKDAPEAQMQAEAALALDSESALAQVALARAALVQGDQAAALQALETAIAFKKDQPYAHLLRGDILRSGGDEQHARSELAYESNKGLLEDIQGWATTRCISPPPARLDVGGGLDLGFVRGFFLPEEGGWRWTEAQASLRLKSAIPGDSLHLRLASGRPLGAPTPSVVVSLDGKQLGTIQVERDWHTYTLPLPRSANNTAPLTIDLRADTFAPRSYDPASPDGRTLGVMVDWAEVGQ